MMSVRRPRGLSHHAKGGILETYLVNSSHLEGNLTGYIERAIDWSSVTERGSYRLLDSFLSDSLTADILVKIFNLSSVVHPARILIVDPSSDFALARAKSIHQVAANEVRAGISNILTAISRVIRCNLPALDDLTFEALVALVQDHAPNAGVEVRFYSEVPSGPAYFFKDILLSGRFCAGLSSSHLPWSMIIDDPHYDGDLYDVYSAEFDRIWNKARTSPEQRTLASGRGDSRRPVFDLGIITATQVEWNALLALPNCRWEALSEISEGGATFYHSTFELNGRRLSVVATLQSGSGMVCGAIAATRLLQLARVNFLASIGICAAVPKRAKLGSIIIADQVFDAQAGKIVDGKFQANAAAVSLDVGLVQMIRHRASAYLVEAEKLCSSLRRPQTRTPPVFGKVATVSQVIADSEFAKPFWNYSRQCVALEMESYAIFRAAEEAKSERGPRTMFIKTAADYADKRKSDIYQEYCASLSAHFLWLFSMERLAR